MTGMPIPWRSGECCIGPIIFHAHSWWFFDRRHAAVKQCDESFSLLAESSILTPMVHIDSIGIDVDGSFLCYDSQQQSIYCMPSSIQSGLKPHAVWPLPPTANITALISYNAGYLFLDQANALLHLATTKQEIGRTMGGRQLSFPELDEPAKIGFESPADMRLWQDKIYVCDTGNQRFVVLNMDLCYNQAFDLPASPVRIITFQDDMVALALHTGQILWLSLQFGIVGISANIFPLIWETAACHADMIVAWQDDCSLVTIPLADTKPVFSGHGDPSLEALRLALHAHEHDRAREMALQSSDLLWQYCALTGGDDVTLQLKSEFQRVSGEISKQIQLFQDEISGLAERILQCYLDLAQGVEREEVAIRLIQVRQALIRKIVHFRHIWQLFCARIQLLEHNEDVSQAVCSFWQQMDNAAKQRLDILRHDIVRLAEIGDERQLVRIVIEERVLWETVAHFRQSSVLLSEFFFGSAQLSDILNNWYFHISQLVVKLHRHDLFSKYAYQELQLFPDKIDIAMAIVDHLLQSGKETEALSILNQYQSAGKENVHLKLFQILQNRGEYKEAYAHLKQEYSANPLRHDLLPLLVSSAQLTRAEADVLLAPWLTQATGAVDVAFHLAQAYVKLADTAKAVSLLELELQHYPQNRPAREYYLEILTKEQNLNFTLIWQILLPLLAPVCADQTETAKLYLLHALNHVGLTHAELEMLLQIAERASNQQWASELLVFVSFYSRHILTGGIVSGPEYQPQDYLAALSTQVLAQRYFHAQVDRFLETDQSGNAIALAQIVLTWQPEDDILLTEWQGSFASQPKDWLTRFACHHELWLQCEELPLFIEPDNQGGVWYSTVQHHQALVLRSDRWGKVVRTIAVPALGNHPFCLYHGHIACLTRDGIELYSEHSGKLERAIKASDLTGVYRKVGYIDALHAFLLADTTGHSLELLTPDGVRSRFYTADRAGRVFSWYHANDAIYVIGFSSPAIIVLNMQGHMQQEIPIPSNQATGWAGLVVTEESMYLINYTQGLVLKMSLAGKLIWCSRLYNPLHPWQKMFSALALDSHTQQLWLCDHRYRAIWRLSLAAEELSRGKADNAE